MGQRVHGRFWMARAHAGTLVGAVAGALHEAEILDVARDCGLRGLEAGAGQPAAQRFLAVQEFAIDQFEDGGLSAGFYGVV